MIGRIKRGLKDLAARTANSVLPDIQKSSPQVKVAQKQLYHTYRQMIAAGNPPELAETGFRVFSQFDEDGLLLYIFACIGVEKRLFVDIGAGDGINSNCANLAINHGWYGLFIDGSEANVERGRRYYAAHPDTILHPPRFECAFVQRENINDIIGKNGLSGVIDFVSIDIDGNDYWVWDALSVVQPRVVIIETHIEFGRDSIVVPYDKDYSYPGKHPDYHGASPVAMAKLARQKGYRLVGSNVYGFNTIYVKRGIGEDLLPEVPVESVFAHPRNAERMKRYEPIKDWEYVQV